MNSKEYVENVIKTESGRFDYQNVSPQALHDIFSLFVASSKAMDVLKRALFYGKPLNQVNLVKAVDEARNIIKWMDHCVHDLKGYGDYGEKPCINPRIIHSVMGLATESGELVESLLKSLKNNSSLDKMNFAEECSDLNWYMAVGLHTENLTFEEVWQKNIDKLKARYGDKFDENKAYNRDVAKEVRAMETGKLEPFSALV